MGKLFVKNVDKTVSLKKGETILSHLQKLGVHIHAFCGGRGVCRACLVKVDDPGWLSPLTEFEKKVVEKPANRLACQAKIVREDVDIFVEVLEYPQFQIMDKGKRINIPLDPLVKKRVVDSTEIVYWEDEKLDVCQKNIYGIALDIGTTTIRLYVIDLQTGEEMASSSMLNPQIRYGNNVIDRINYAMVEHQKYLEITIRDAVNDMIKKTSVDPRLIYELIVVGNPVMRDIFIGHPVESLGRFPYEALSKNSVYLKAKELGVNINSNASIYALPLIGHFVGADALSVILSTEMYKTNDITLAMDIGTNTEIALGNKDSIIVASCASGPAFEGSGLKCGVGAIEGAIQTVTIDTDLTVHFETIGGKPPVGICGSGLIDALAQMLERGILDWTGKFTDEQREFSFYNGLHHIFLDGEDIDSLKLAKSAIMVGLNVVTRHYGVDFQEIEKLYLAGAFGNYINIENAIKIDVLPNMPRRKIEKVGNIALEGARQVLISRERRTDAEKIPKIVDHVSLEKEKDFQEQFINGLFFNNYK